MGRTERGHPGHSSSPVANRNHVMGLEEERKSSFRVWASSSSSSSKPPQKRANEDEDDDEEEGIEFVSSRGAAASKTSGVGHFPKPSHW